MSVGNQATQATVNNILTTLAVQLRQACDAIRIQQTFISGLGLSGLEALGFSAGDAQSVINSMNYLSNVAGCYYGTVQQGGTGGTGAIDFDFDQQLAPLWGGQ